MSNGANAASLTEVGNLSDELLKLSMLLDQMRVTSSNLSPSDIQHLGDIARQLDELSDQLNAAAIGQILQNLQPSLSNIIQTTKDAQSAIKEANTLQKVFSIAGAALTLASALVAGSTSAIGAAMDTLAGTIAGGTASAAAGAPASTPADATASAATAGS